MTSTRSHSHRRAPFVRAVAGAVVAWTIIVSVTVVLAAAVVVPRLGGGTPYTILTSSMRPTMPPGTLVVVRPVDAVDIGVGSVITYQLRSGRATVVTHRVVAQGVGGDGTPIFRTQGDANDAPDEAWVRPVQITGERWYSVRGLGYVNSWVTGGQRSVATAVVVIGLLGYAAAMFVGAVRERARSRTRVSV